MANHLKFVIDRLTRCGSGQRFNPFMHVFVFITAAYSIAFLFFPGSSVGQSILFMQTLEVGHLAVNHWGVIGLTTVIFHLTGLIVRGKIGLHLMRFSIFGGFYIWLWAAVIYLSGGFAFHFFVVGVPNLAFWTWYAWQWRKRYKNQMDATIQSFVN